MAENQTFLHLEVTLFASNRMKHSKGLLDFLCAFEWGYILATDWTWQWNQNVEQRKNDGKNAFEAQTKIMRSSCCSARIEWIIRTSENANVIYMWYGMGISNGSLLWFRILSICTDSSWQMRIIRTSMRCFRDKDNETKNKPDITHSSQTDGTPHKKSINLVSVFVTASVAVIVAVVVALHCQPIQYSQY